MSLIPYNSQDSRSIVLRHQQTVVLYDPQTAQIVLRQATPSAEPVPSSRAHHPDSCPYCNRPFDDSSSASESDARPPMPHRRSRSTGPLAEHGYVDPAYFRMLGSSSFAEGPSRRLESPRRLPRLQTEDSQESAAGPEEPSPSKAGGIDQAAFSTKYFERFFVTERELGRGGKGVVLLVKHILDGVSLGNFACKRVPVGDNHKWLEKVLIEVQLLQRLSHQNLVSYRHVWLEDVKLTTFGPSVPCAFILQQYCNAGDLHSYILTPNKPAASRKEQLKAQLRRRSLHQLEKPPATFKKLPFEQIISFFRDITAGLSHLHANGFIHRDLKPSNCLLHDSGSSYPKVLVSDFGEVQMENTLRTSTGNTGTISYCAPEVLLRAPGGEYQNFTTKSDIFSLGMILHFMCFGKLPYAGSDALNEENENLDQLREEITAWQGLAEQDRQRTDLPERLYQSLKTLISPDPNVRPTAEEILVSLEVGIGEAAATKPVPKPRVGMQDGSSRISPIADTPPPSTPPRKITPEPVEVVTRSPRPSKLGLSPMRASSSPTVEATEESSLVLRPRMEAVSRIEDARESLLERGFRMKVHFAVKVVLYMAKIVTLNRTCFPTTLNPWVYYSLAGLGVLDFAAPEMALTVVLGVVHVAVVMAAGRRVCLY